MLEFIAENFTNINAFITALAAIFTAIATFFLWRVTNLLAKETKRMVDAAEQPHVVVTLEPNMWAVFHFDICITNTGNSPAYNIHVDFDPPLINADHRERSNHSIPFSNISVLKNGQSLTSNICEYEKIKDTKYNIKISWSKRPNSQIRDEYEYVYDMASFDGISYLGARNPVTQIADQIKKIREDWRPVTQGQKKLKTDTYNSKDRDLEAKTREEQYNIAKEEYEKRKNKKIN